MKGEFIIDSAEELMLRVKAGDREAFDHLITEFRGPVINTVFRITGSRSDAEDLAQQVFFKIYRARERYEVKAKFTTWMLHIVRNVCFNYLRSSKKQTIVSIHGGDEEDSWDLPSSQPDPMQLAVASELQDAIHDAIQNLPPNQRTAVVLAKFEGRPYAEIAEILETSEAAVKMLIKRAKANLSKTMAPYLNEEGV